MDKAFKILLIEFMLIVLQHLRRPNLTKDAPVDNLSKQMQTYKSEVLNIG